MSASALKKGSAVLWSFAPFFALMFAAFVAVFLLHRSYKRRLEIASAREAKEAAKRHPQHKSKRDDDDNNDDDDDDDDDDDRHRTAKQLQHRAEKKRVKEARRAYREQMQEQRDRALDEEDYNADPRAPIRAAEQRAAQAAQFAQEKEHGRWQAAARSAAESASLRRKEQIERQVLSVADIVRRRGAATLEQLAVELDVPIAPLRAHVLSLDADDAAGGLFLLDGDRLVYVDRARVDAVRAWVQQRGRFDAAQLCAAVNETWRVR